MPTNTVRSLKSTVLSAKSCVYTGTHVAGYKLYPLVAVDMFLVSATKLLTICCPSVAGYKGIKVDRDINE